MDLEIIDVASLDATVPAKHFKLQARQIAASGGGGPAVAHTFMEQEGGAEMHTHEDLNHVFYVLEGEMQVYDGKERRLVPKGSALVVPAGEAHQVTGTGKMACEYLVVTSSNRRTEAW